MSSPATRRSTTTSKAGLTGLTHVLAEPHRARARRAGRPRSGARRTRLLSRSSTGRSSPGRPQPSRGAIAQARRLHEGRRHGHLRHPRRLSARPGGGADAGGATSCARMLATLDIPELEPVPRDHVLTKTFYLLDNFPGRYATGQTWVEALPPADATRERRPARAGDGVSPIIITSNDLAAAWAVGRRGEALYPVRRRRSAPARDRLPRRRQHRHVHADRQLQGRPGPRAGAARTARPIDVRACSSIEPLDRFLPMARCSLALWRLVVAGRRRSLALVLVAAARRRSLRALGARARASLGARRIPRSSRRTASR